MEPLSKDAVEVSSLSELTSYHCPVFVEVHTQMSNNRDEHQMVDWQCFGPVPCHRLPKAMPLKTTSQVDEAAALFDEAVVTVIDASARIKPGFIPDYQWTPEEILLLASKKYYLWTSRPGR